MNDCLPDPALPLAAADDAVIPAQSRAQAMEWGLVLASQSISSTLECSEGSWRLLVSQPEQAPASAQIALYEKENISPPAGRTLDRLSIHPAALGWVGVWSFLFSLDAMSGWALREVGALNVARCLHGEWWRCITATFLHADAGHLTSNAAAGLLILGFSGRVAGAGLTSFLALVAGVLGNLLVLLVREPPAVSLGASGLVLGGLGIMAGAASSWAGTPREKLLPWIGSILMFTLLGTDPQSDLVAHAGGFAAGILLGMVCRPLWKSHSVTESFDPLGAFLALVISLVAWSKALLS